MLKAYNFLQSKKTLSESDTIILAHWARFDPRLGEQLVGALQTQWPNINPLELRKKNLKSHWPQATLVILEHLKQIQLQEPDLYDLFYQLVTHKAQKAPYQFFYIGLYPIAAKQMLKQALDPHPIYAKWGYYATDPMWSKSTKLRQATTLKPSERKKILKKLIEEKKEITVSDYLRACHFSVHRRQAERDLKEAPQLKAIGNTKLRVYRKAKN